MWRTLLRNSVLPLFFPLHAYLEHNYLSCSCINFSTTLVPRVAWCAQSQTILELGRPWESLKEALIISHDCGNEVPALLDHLARLHIVG